MKNIVLVEDDPSIAKLVEFKLKKTGYNVVRFVNPVGVMDYLLNNNVDLILSDVMMPVIDGIEMIKEIKKIEKIADIPIVLLTSLGHESAVLSGIEAGAADYIVKPFSTVELVARIRNILN